MLSYSFLQSFWCQACGTKLQLGERHESNGREEKTFLLPCPKCTPNPAFYASVSDFIQGKGRLPIEPEGDDSDRPLEDHEFDGWREGH